MDLWPHARVVIAGATVALLFSTPGAWATVDVRAKEVLANYVTAMGGDAFLAARVIHTKSTESTASQTKLVVDTWSVRPDRYLVRVVPEGSSKSAVMGYDGSLAWSDMFGHVERLGSTKADNLRGRAWFISDGFVLPDQGGGDVAYIGVESDSTATYAILDCASPAGPKYRGLFDLQTGLMTKMTTKIDDNTPLTEYYGDFRRVAGRMFAFHRVSVRADARRSDIAVDSVWVNEEIAGTFFAMRQAVAATTSPEERDAEQLRDAMIGQSAEGVCEKRLAQEFNAQTGVTWERARESRSMRFTGVDKFGGIKGTEWTTTASSLFGVG